jgi:hypothetical protein
VHDGLFPIGDKVSDMSKKRVQLWTNDTSSEFEIIYDHRILVRTKEDVNYDRMIDETDWVAAFDHDWGYTLSQWVPFYFSNKFLNQVLDRTKKRRFRIDPGSGIDRQSELFTHAKSESRSRPGTKPKVKPGLKCHFCNLKYCLEEERKDHEEFWHPNKFIKT